MTSLYPLQNAEYQLVGLQKHQFSKHIHSNQNTILNKMHFSEFSNLNYITSFKIHEHLFFFSQVLQSAYLMFK